MNSAPQDITGLLVAWGNGDRSALNTLVPLVQQELRRVASRQMARERPGHVLQPTALVNEAYVRLVDWQHVRWQNRAQFFGVAAKIMRRILVNSARTRDTMKRGGDAMRVSLNDIEEPAAPTSTTYDLIALDNALEALGRLNPRESQVIELRFFGGLSLEETAEVLHVSVATVRRDWTLARAWLFRELSGTHPA